MSKRKRTISAPLLCSNGTQETFSNIIWSVCCLCQETGGVLVCPARNPNTPMRYAGYSSPSTNLEILRQFNYLLHGKIKIGDLDEGKGICQTMIDRDARWHKSCALAFQQPKFSALLKQLEREQKAKEEESRLDTPHGSAPPQHPASTPHSQPHTDILYVCYLVFCAAIA